MDFNERATVLELITLAKSKCTPHISNWKDLNKSFIYKAKIKQASMKKQNKSSAEKLDLDKLFREKEKNSDHMNDNKVKLFFLKFILNYLRSHSDTITAAGVRRVIKKFCLSEAYATWRKEAFNFVGEVLEMKPPINLEGRHFWIEVFVAKESELCFRKALKEFREGCLEIICQNKYPTEHRKFLLSMLEYDYAAVQSREYVKSGLKIIDLNDMNGLPLAYLLIAKANHDFTIFKENEDFEIYKILSELFCKTTDINEKHLYAQFIALLIDVNTFMCHNKFYIEMEKLKLQSWDEVPEAVENTIKQLRLQFSRKKDLMVLLLSFILSYAPWINSILDPNKKRLKRSKKS